VIDAQGCSSEAASGTVSNTVKEIAWSIRSQVQIASSELPASIEGY
jgi:hypothetical protein